VINIKEAKSKRILSELFSRTACIALSNLLRLLNAFYNDLYTINIIETLDGNGNLFITLPLTIE
jgi:uncharacterized protein YerC